MTVQRDLRELIELLNSTGVRHVDGVAMPELSDEEVPDESEDSELEDSDAFYPGTGLYSASEINIF